MGVLQLSFWMYRPVKKLMNRGAWECVRRTTATMNTETTEFIIETTKYIIECRNLTLTDVFTASRLPYFLTYVSAVGILRLCRTKSSDSGYQFRLVQIQKNEHGSPTVTILDV